jgi:hypothetical protein
MGILLVYLIYSFLSLRSQNLYKQYILLTYLSCKKFFADAFNSYYVFLPTVSFSLNVTYKLLDQGILEYLGPNTHNFIESMFKNLMNIETTLLIYRAFLFLIFSLGALVAIFSGLNVINLLLFFIITQYLFKTESQLNSNPA